MKLVDYVESVFSDVYKSAVVGNMLDSLEYVRDTVLPKHAMEILGVPTSVQSRLRLRVGILDDAVHALESFEYYKARGESFEWLAKKYWEVLNFPDEVNEHWLSQNRSLIEQSMHDFNYDYEEAYTDVDEFFEDAFWEITDLVRADLVVGEFAVDLPRTFWSGLDANNKGMESIDDNVMELDTTYAYSNLRDQVIGELSLYVDEDDLDYTLDNLGECIISSIGEAVEELDLRLMHVNEHFDAELGVDEIKEGIKLLNEYVPLLFTKTEMQDAANILNRCCSLGCVFVKSLAEFTISDIKGLKTKLSSKGLPFVLVQEGEDIAVPSEYSSVFDHVYLLGCFCYASVKREVRVEFQTYTGVIEFVNDNRYLVRDFGVRGVPPHLPYLNVVNLDVGSGAEVRIPLDLFQDSYRDIRVQSKNAVSLTVPTWDGLKCVDPKLQLCLDYTGTVQVDFSEINRLFFTKKAYIGCDIKQLKNQEESGYLGKRFPSEFRCSGSFCVVEDGTMGALVFSNMRYGYDTLIVATGAFFKSFGNVPTMHFDHLMSPEGFSEASPKRGESYSNSIIWSYPSHADYSGCSFYKCILVDGEPKNSVSVLALNEKYDRTIVVSKQIEGADKDFSLDEWL